MDLKILIADDHCIVLLGTKMILESAFPRAKVETTSSYVELLNVLKNNNFNILLLDINMPGSKNMVMIHEIKRIKPELKIVIFSSYDEQVALNYIRAGADGYINKMSEKNEIIYAIKSVTENGFYYSLKLTKLAMNQPNNRNQHKDPRTLLSDREFEVFELLIAGLGNLEIACKLNLHMSTISTYKKRILEKLNMANIAELIKNYYQFNQN